MIKETIRTLFASGDIDGIIHQVDMILEDRNQIRAENIGLKHEIHRLAEALAKITEPNTGKSILEEPRPPFGTRYAVTKPKQSQITERPPPPAPLKTSKPKPSKEALDLDL